MLPNTGSSAATATPEPVHVQELVLNWHITEACNYHCGYCYSAWERTPHQPDVVRDEAASTELLNTLAAFFHPGNPHNPLRRQLRWQHLRLSLAGGEPLLYPQHVARLASQARALGLRVSLITNGSRLPQAPDELAHLARQLDMLGLSLDAFTPADNQAIGRADRHGNSLDPAQLARQIDHMRRVQPGLVLKLNTVVNARNVHLDLRPSLARLQPERWKVLRMLPVLGQTLAVNDAEFAAFVQRHATAMGNRMSVEDNSDMLGSYLMIDPQGRFFQNGTGRQGSYFYSPPIRPDTIERALRSVPFDARRFASRYGHAPADATAATPARATPASTTPTSATPASTTPTSATPSTAGPQALRKVADCAPAPALG